MHTQSSYQQHFFGRDSSALSAVAVDDHHTLYWRADLGVGYMPAVFYCDYGLEYWEKYQGYRGTDINKKLTEARYDFVLSIANPALGCDVGIGNGDYTLRSGGYGYDINHYAIQWLRSRGRYADPTVIGSSVLTFWDSLEHIDNLDPLLKQNKPNTVNWQSVFVSCPIHKDLDTLLASKHLRPSEHIWHFTEAGLKHFFDYYKYQHLATTNVEQLIGREDILSFAFERNHD